MALSPLELEESIRALGSGAAFVDRSVYRSVAVSGADGRRWLNDLLTADLAAVPRGGGQRSLLLTPTGRIRADISVIALGGGFALVQDPEQPEAIDDALAPYVLSSDVHLERADLVLLCAPGGDPSPPPAIASLAGAEIIRPSMLGGGFDVVLARGRDAPAARRAIAARRTEVGEPAVRAWEVRGGVARFPHDLTPDSYPAEAEIDASIVDSTKGCFLGQESVARIRNLGHPPYVVRAASADGDVRSGDPVRALEASDETGDRMSAGARAVPDAGIVTSAAPWPGGGTAAIVRIRWAARERPLATQSGVALRLS
jgi:tRNA-modifying protein YgfZ